MLQVFSRVTTIFHASFCFLNILQCSLYQSAIFLARENILKRENLLVKVVIGFSRILRVFPLVRCSSRCCRLRTTGAEEERRAAHQQRQARRRGIEVSERRVEMKRDVELVNVLQNLMKMMITSFVEGMIS